MDSAADTQRGVGVHGDHKAAQPLRDPVTEGEDHHPGGGAEGHWAEGQTDRETEGERDVGTGERVAGQGERDEGREERGGRGTGEWWGEGHRGVGGEGGGLPGPS